MTHEGGHHWLDREDIDDITVVRFRLSHLHGEDTSRDISQLLSSLVDEAGRSQIVLNLGRVESIDTSGISRLVLLNRKTQAAGGRLALCQLSPVVDEVFKTMHLSGVFNIYPQEQQAVESFRFTGPQNDTQCGG